jgi:hypothetical protein
VDSGDIAEMNQMMVPSWWGGAKFDFIEAENRYSVF